MSNRHLPPPLEPRTLEQHCARWELVKTRFFTLAELDGFAQTGVPPAHRFDFDSGLRLIITHEDHGNGALFAHCSASVFAGIERELAATFETYGFGLAFRRLESLALGCAEAITGIPVGRWRHSVLSHRKGVPNWWAALGQ